MNYRGKLFGKVGRRYVPLMMTSEEVDAIIAERDELKAWQPIETAPTDGTQVIVWDGERVVAAHFDATVWSNGWVEWCYRSDADTIEPKMWKPLPISPESCQS